jgi:hypothetical protein
VWEGYKKNDIDTVLRNRNLCKKQGEHKILILGDNDTRTLAGRLRDILTDKLRL